jgi:hypothetical protein
LGLRTTIRRRRPRPHRHVLLSHSENPGGELHADPALNAAGDRAIVVWGRGEQAAPGDDNVYAMLLSEPAPDPSPNPDPGPGPTPDPIPNSAPTAAPIAPLVAVEDAEDTVIPLWTFFQDSQDADSALRFAVTGNTNAALFSDLRINPADGTLTIDYAPGATGAAQLSVTATDIGGLSFTLPFTVIVNPPVGVLFDDADGNGKQSKGETGLPGVTVFLDSDADGVPDAGELATTTEPDGSYAFTAVPAGPQHVAVVPPSGMVLAASVPARPLVVKGRRPAKAKPIGLMGAGSISGTVYYDSNLDSRQNGEAGLRGFRVFLDANGDRVRHKTERWVKTDAQGNYRITGLAPGTYRVDVARVKGWIRWTDAVLAHVDGGESISNNFGVFRNPGGRL